MIMSDPVSLKIFLARSGFGSIGKRDQVSLKVHFNHCKCVRYIICVNLWFVCIIYLESCRYAVWFAAALCEIFHTFDSPYRKHAFLIFDLFYYSRFSIARNICTLCCPLYTEMHCVLMCRMIWPSIYWRTRSEVNTRSIIGGLMGLMIGWIMDWLYSVGKITRL